MVLKFIKTIRNVNYFLLPFLGGLFWLKSLLDPFVYPYYRGESENLLYLPLEKLTEGSVFLQSLFSLVIVIILALFIHYINNKYIFIHYRSILPSILFIFIISGFRGMHTMHPVYLGAFFMLISVFRLFSAFDKAKSYPESFDSGFFLGIASLFYFKLLILFPAMLYGIGTLTREKNWREYVLITTGLVLPFFLTFSYTFITDQWLETLKIFEYNLLTNNNHIKSDIKLQFYLGYLILLTLTGSYVILKQYDTLKVSTRKYFTIFFLMFVSSLAGLLIIPAASQEMLVITAIPFTYLISNYFISIKSRFWGETLFLTFIAIIVFLQITS